MNKTPLILIADNDLLLLGATQRVLEQAGFHTCQAGDGSSALQIAREQKPDLTLLDVDLPDISGVEVCRLIKADPALEGCFVVLYSSARTETQILHEGFESEADRYFTRPINNADLLAHVRGILRSQQTEKALRESEQRLREVLDHSLDASYKHNLQTSTYDYLSPVFERLSGYPAGELRSLSMQGFLNLIHPEDQAEVKRQVDLAISGPAGQPFQMEYRFMHKDGQARWFRDQFSLIRDQKGSALALTGSMGDITGRKQAENDLRESEERFRLLFETAIDGTLMTAPDGHILAANASACRMLERTEDEIKQLGRSGVVDPSDPRLALAVEERARTGKFVGELTLIRKNGEKFPAEVSSALFTDRDGNVRTSMSFHDISERKQAENALRASEQLYHDMFDNISAVKLLVDPLSGDIVKANQAAADFYGWPGAMIETMNLNQINLLPDGQIKILMANAIDRNRRHFDVQHRLASGAVRDVEVYTGPIVLDGRKLLFSIVHDISDRKKAEAELQAAHNLLEQRVAERTAELSAANLQLEQAGRLKDEFLSSMSHELRTPLTGILGLSEVLLMPHNGALNEKQSTYIRHINDSGQHLLELINQILDFSMLEAGELKLAPRACDLEKICQASLQTTAKLADAKHLQTSFTIEPASIILKADAHWLTQIVDALLGNAIKFTPQGGSVGIEVTGAQSAGQVSITVWDTGIGIPQQDLARLFQPFVQLDARLSRQYEGTGLGLALVQRLTRLHGGSVSVQSTPGLGSRFTVLLPWR